VPDEPDASDGHAGGRGATAAGGRDANTTVGEQDAKHASTLEEDEPDDDGESIFGEAVPAVPVEPGTPSLENAAFVVLGVASTVALILHLISLLG